MNTTHPLMFECSYNPKLWIMFNTLNCSNGENDFYKKRKGSLNSGIMERPFSDGFYPRCKWLDGILSS